MIQLDKIPFIVYYRPLMTSSRLILIFLAFIFLIIIILSSTRISNSLRSRFGNMVPSLKPTTDEITPTPTVEEQVQTPTPTPTIFYGKTTTNGKIVQNIPATGPADLVWLVLGGSFFTGVTLKKITSKIS